MIAFVLLRASSCPSIRPEGSLRGTRMTRLCEMFTGPKEESTNIDMMEEN